MSGTDYYGDPEFTSNWEVEANNAHWDYPDRKACQVYIRSAGAECPGDWRCECHNE